MTWNALAIVGRVVAHQVHPGDTVRVRLAQADPAARQVDLQRVG